MKYSAITDLVGGTPLVRLDFPEISAEIYAKFELYNLTGSAKDRMAFYMLSQAVKKGLLKKGGTIIEATTGNTGIAFSALAAARGYKMIAVMPEGQSIERMQMMKAFGAEVILTPREEGPAGAIKKRDDLCKETKGAWKPDQFANEDNIRAHMETTAQELIAQTGGQIDYIVHGVGTGGTLIGVARIFKQRFPHVKIVAVEPAESAVMKGGSPGEHNIQGIGEGFIPDLVDLSLIDEVEAVSTADAISAAKMIGRTQGVLVGFSSGANMAAIRQMAEKHGKGKKFVTFFCDRGERYLSDKAYR